jgi:hypothetical protein
MAPKLSKRAKVMRSRRALAAQAETELFARYPPVPTLSSQVYNTSYRQTVRTPDKMKIQKPVWEEDDDCDSDGHVKFSCGVYRLLLRQDSADILCKDEIFVRNIYKKSLAMGGKHWLDIGAHVGLFSLAALMSGATDVVAYEPFSPNYELARYNTSGFNVEFSAGSNRVFLDHEPL